MTVVRQPVAIEIQQMGDILQLETFTPSEAEHLASNAAFPNWLLEERGFSTVMLESDVIGSSGAWTNPSSGPVANQCAHPPIPTRPKRTCVTNMRSSVVSLAISRVSSRWKVKQAHLTPS